MMATENRLIDANALLYEYCQANGCNEVNDEVCPNCFTAALIASAPTVDAAPVVHGHWVHVPSSDMMTGKAYKCSECNKMRYGSFMPNYCQNCGARMDGDGNG